MNELFGTYNELTQQYEDGLVSKIIREFMMDARFFDYQWVVFDGPVDSQWGENLNTVLDDSSLLCLPNGERIKLR